MTQQVFIECQLQGQLRADAETPRRAGGGPFPGGAYDEPRGEEATLPPCTHQQLCLQTQISFKQWYMEGPIIIPSIMTKKQVQGEQVG